MSGAPALLQCAQQRAAALRDRYREAGFWSGQPADIVRAAAALHPEKLALCARGAELSYAELDARIDAACGALAHSGVGASTPTVVVVGNDVDSVVAVHATMRLDADGRRCLAALEAAAIESEHAILGMMGTARPPR